MSPPDIISAQPHVRAPAKRSCRPAFTAIGESVRAMVEDVLAEPQWLRGHQEIRPREFLSGVANTPLKGPMRHDPSDPLNGPEPSRQKRSATSPPSLTRQRPIGHVVSRDRTEPHTSAHVLEARSMSCRRDGPSRRSEIRQRWHRARPPAQGNS